MVQRKKATKSTFLDFIIRERGFEADFPDEILDNLDAEKLRVSFLNDKYRCLYELSFRNAEDWFSPSLKYLHRVAGDFILALSRTPDIEITREDTTVDADTSATAAAVPFIAGSEYVTSKWVSALWNKMAKMFREDISSYNGTIEMYLAEKNTDLHAPGRIFFHLVENRTKNLPFAFMATYSPETDGKKKVKHLPLKYALEEYGEDERKILRLLSYLSKVSDRSDLISGLMESGELFHPLGFTSEEAYNFLKEVPIYEECGILCRIPNWWKKRSSSSVNIKFGENKVGMGSDALLSCEPEMTVDGEPMTEEEVRTLLKSSEGLALLKGKWVEVNHDKLKRLLDRFESVKSEYGDEISVSEAMKITAGMNSDKNGDVDLGVTNREWVEEMMSRIASSEEHRFKLPRTFKGKLRPYQRKGAEWLEQLRGMGFGACLADDMGLGKTVQMLAFLEFRRKKDKRNLLIVPASLIGNWQKEAEKFTPGMEIAVIHGTSDTIPEVPLTITTYGMIAKRDMFTQIKWDTVILDEAQAIKNPGTKQSKAVRAIKGKFKVALTGTPVENRLSDLWSLFDFINRGFLGDEHEFSRFSSNISDSGYGKLRSMISPFVLRRLKTDKSIIGDLPSKIEKDEFVSLSKKQLVLYKDRLDDLRETLDNGDSEKRLGAILSAITKFKQICNHPDQYLGQKVFAENESGKFEMLRQICETIHEKREKVLVFTQYKEMTEPIAGLLKDVFGKGGMVFHGGMTPNARTQAVERFNSEDEYIPFMIISLKAGGVGLNLTSANHVIHFDRWWNPAVENQATDRAFRIGQKKDVMVHKFICKGTMEERIDELIKSKSELANNIIGSGGGNMLSDMNNDEIMDLFTLEAS